MAERAAKLTEAQREALERLVGAAGDGRQPEVERILRTAGWVRVNDPVTVGELGAAVPKLTRATVALFEQQGLPVELAGRRKCYRPLAVLRWVCERFVHLARRRDRGGEAAEPEEVVGTQAELAERLGVAERTVRNWLRAGAPRRPDGTYSVGAVRGWHEGAGGGGAGESESLAELKRKLTAREVDYREARTKLTNLEVAVREGRLVTRAEVEARRAAQVVVAKQALLRLPAKLAPRLEGRDRLAIEEALQAEVRECLDGLRARPATVGDVLGGVLEEFADRLRLADGPVAARGELLGLWQEALEVASA